MLEPLAVLVEPLAVPELCQDDQPAHSFADAANIPEEKLLQQPAELEKGKL